MKKTTLAAVCLLAAGAFAPFWASAQAYYGGGYQPTMYGYGYGPYSAGDMSGMYYYNYPNPAPQSVMHPYYTLATPPYYARPSSYGYAPSVPTMNYGNSNAYYYNTYPSYGYPSYTYGYAPQSVYVNSY